MAFSFGFFNAKNLDRTYTAENFCDYLGSLICNGIQDNYGECFKLTAGSGLSVTVGRGKAWINGHYFINDSRYSIDLSEYLDESLPRYVGIAIYLDTTEAVRNVSLKLFPGTPAETPGLPSIPQDSNHVRLLMYAVRLAPGATTLSERDWYDYREDSNVCGYCKCILGKCRVTDMLSEMAQINATLDTLKEENEALANKVDALEAEVEDIGDVIEAGQCGERVFYVLYSTGKLLLRGSGATYDYDSPLESSHQDSPFCDNQNIKNVVVSNGITELGEYLFRYCDELETASLPKSLTNIKRMAFYPRQDNMATPVTARGLTELTIPASVTEIGYCAFAGSRIETLTIPKTVTTMGERIFSACIRLTTVRFEAATIPAFAFVNCNNLVNVTLSHNVKKISSHWINYCRKLTEITYEGSLADWSAVTKLSNWDGRSGQIDGSLARINCLDGYMEFDTETREWVEVHE